LRCTARTYRITQVTWPTVALTSPAPTVEIVGARPNAVVPFCPGTGGDFWDVPLPTAGTVFRSTATSGQAAFGGNLSAISNLLVVFRNLIVTVPADPACHGIDGGYLLNMTTDNVLVTARDASGNIPTTGKGATEVVEPLNLAEGIIYPGEGNGGVTQARNTTVVGFYYGARHSEHFIADNLTVFKCKEGLRPSDGWHAATYGRVSLYWCTKGLVAKKFSGSASHPVTRLVANQVDFEETDEASVWYKTAAHLDDPNNYLRGRLRTHRMKAAVGISGPLLRNGGAYLDLAPVGAMPRSVLDVVGFEGTNSTTVLPNTLSTLPPTQHRGTWGISSNQGYIATVGSPDAIASWHVGSASHTVHTKITTQSAGSRNIGVAFNLVDVSNYLLVAIGSTTLTVQKVSAGTYTSLASAAFTSALSTTYDLLVIQRGGRVQAYIDGTLIVSYTLTSGEWTQYGVGLSAGLWAYCTGYEPGGATGSRWNFVRFEAPHPVTA
jgi:hypothetical protein